MIVTLSAVDLDAKEDARRLSGQLAGRVGTVVRAKEEDVARLAGVVEAALTLGGQQVAGNLVPVAVLLQLLGHPPLEGTRQGPATEIRQPSRQDVAPEAPPVCRIVVA